MEKAETIQFEDLYDPNDTPEGILPFLLGEGDDGQKIWMDMACNPHLLVAGATGSGKSIFLHILIANALKRKDVDLMLVDPKFGVEFGKYSNQAEVANNYDDAILFLETLELLMNSRYQRMAKLGVNSIEQRPELFTKKLLIVDEAADLMLLDSSKRNPNRGLFETKICGIAQKARAAGIYLVLATQRPSVDVITGLIKSNFPARLACQVSTAIDSKVILDCVGAEALLGRGDAILNSPQHNYTRFQVAYIKP
jgi:S-DNA-T family DNA segregation ATPase FtsK/SpoIIIE